MAKAINGIKEKRTKKDMEAIKHYAFILYLQNIPQNEISVRCNVSVKTISDWKLTNGWEDKRASKNISMDALIVKALRKINEMLDAKDFSSDAFAKAVSQLKTLKHRNTVDDEIMCFLDFQNFLMDRKQIEKLDEAFLKQVVKLQDQYIQIKIANV